MDSAMVHATSKLFPTSFIKPLTGSTLRLRSRSTIAGRSNQLRHDADSTIYALSTAPGRAAIAVIRVSGPACEQIYRRLCPDRALPKPRQASLRTLYAPNALQKDVLDAGALVLYFPAPSTTTGDTVLELHTHGSPAIVRAVFKAISHCSTPTQPIRPAEPGEFTRRAFMNDRLSLPQVEALGNTLEAVTEEQRRLSVQSSSGDLAARYESWRAMLLAARGELEALIDFSEDQHFDEKPSVLAASVAQQVRHLVASIEICSRNAVRGELLRNGIAISLIGLPNVGKSSILNQIVGRNAAIVSKEAGTTRDVIEVGIDLGGFLCRIGDTAGLRESRSAEDDDELEAGNRVGEIEAEGMRRAKVQAMQSDVVILVLSVEHDHSSSTAGLQLDPSILATARELLASGKKVIVVVNKFDVYGDEASDSTMPSLRSKVTNALPSISEGNIYIISVREAANISAPVSSQLADPGNFQAFLTGLARTFRSLTTALRPGALLTPESLGSKTMDDDGCGRGNADADTSDTMPGTSVSTVADANIDASADAHADTSIWEASLGATERQRVLLSACLTALHQFLDLVGTEDEGEIDIVLLAEHLRTAASALGRITGKGEEGDVEEVLGVVFEK